MTPEYIFTVLYILLSICIIYPPIEFIAAGFTVASVFGSFLGSEDEEFVRFHLRRSSLTLFVYTLLPLGYVMGLVSFAFDENVSLFTLLEERLFWKLLLTISIAIPIVTAIYVSHWSKDNWNNHPIAYNLHKFCNNNNSWEDVASDINREYRRLEKVCIQTTAITKVIATENWLIKVTPLNLFVAYQSDTNLVVKQADTHHITPVSSNELQYVTIEVQTTRRNVPPFTIRINALDYSDLQDRISRPITVAPDVKFHKSVIDQFVETFRETVEQNPKYSTDQRMDQCIGCLQTEPNVKIQKLCESSDRAEDCQTCYCRPMWCVECLAKWFASRQEPDVPNTWLSSKGTCPMCRARFCVLDVCFLEAVGQ